MSAMIDGSARASALIAIDTADAGHDPQKQVYALSNTIRSLCHQHQAAINLMLPPDTDGSDHEVSVHLSGITEPLIAHVAIEADSDEQGQFDTVLVNKVYLRGVDIFCLMTEESIGRIADESVTIIKRRYRAELEAAREIDEVTA